METCQPESLILFICTGNTCRSPMAAALFNQLNRNPGWRAESAGLAAFPGEPASALAIVTLQEDYGLDLTGHRSRRAEYALLREAEWIVTMTGGQKDALCQAFPDLADRIRTIGEMAGQPEQIVPDPYGRGLAVYQATAAALAMLVEKIVSRLGQISDIGERQD